MARKWKTITEWEWDNGIKVEVGKSYYVVVRKLPSSGQFATIHRMRCVDIKRLNSYTVCGHFEEVVDGKVVGSTVFTREMVYSTLRDAKRKLRHHVSFALNMYKDGVKRMEQSLKTLKANRASDFETK